MAYDRIALAARLMREKTLRLKPEINAQGRVTIGIGRNLSDAGISEAEAIFLLGSDISRTEAALDANIPWWRKLDDVRQAVLMDLAFDLGERDLGMFQRSLTAAQGGNYGLAAAELRATDWYKSVGHLAGERGFNLAQAMESGVMPK